MSSMEFVNVQAFAFVLKCSNMHINMLVLGVSSLNNFVDLSCVLTLMLLKSEGKTFVSIIFLTCPETFPLAITIHRLFCIYNELLQFTIYVTVDGMWSMLIR